MRADPFTLRQADQARTDFAIIEDELVPVHKRMLFSGVARRAVVRFRQRRAFARGSSSTGRGNRLASRGGRADLAGCAVTGRGWRSYAGLRRASSTRLWATAADQM